MMRFVKRESIANAR